ERAGELGEAATVRYPVELRLQRRGLVEAARPRRRGAPDSGTALAPGWAEGVLVRESDGERDRIVAGDRGDGNYVLAVVPSGVVSKYGSVLSHVAIVCRELGIPFVAGIETSADAIGKRATVDGWTGTVTVEASGHGVSR